MRRYGQFEGISLFNCALFVVDNVMTTVFGGLENTTTNHFVFCWCVFCRLTICNTKTTMSMGQVPKMRV